MYLIGINVNTINWPIKRTDTEIARKKNVNACVKGQFLHL